MPAPPRPKLTEGPVGQRLRELTIPTFWGVFAMMSFNIVDTWFVGQLGTREEALAWLAGAAREPAHEGGKTRRSPKDTG